MDGPTIKTVVRRLRWLMLAIILIDLLLTLYGQPRSFWLDPATALEPNAPVRHIMVRGVGPFFLVVTIYCTVAFLLVSFLPPWIGLVTALVFTLGHFYAGSTWLEARMGLGINGVYLYAVPLAIAIAICTRLPDRSSA